MSIFGKLFGDTELDDLLNKFNDLSNSISIIGSREDIEASPNVFDEYVKVLKDEELSFILANLTVPVDRLARYKVYDELYSNVQLIKRIFKVYKDNILQRNLISGDILLFKPHPEHHITNTEYDNLVEFIKKVIKRYDIVTKLKNYLLLKLLKYGDYFIEIIDLANPQIEIPKYPKRNTVPISSILNNYLSAPDQKIIESITDLICEINTDIHQTSEEDNLLLEEYKKLTGRDKVSILSIIDRIDLDRVILRFHKPHKVVIITSPKDETFILGYVVVEETEDQFERVLSPGLRFASVLNKLETNGKDRLDRVAETILKKIAEKIIKSANIEFEYDPTLSKQENELQYQAMLYKQLQSTTFYTLKNILANLVQYDTLNKRISVRFIPTVRMVHLTIPSPEYYPYGLSLIDPLVLPGKLYLLHSLANIVMRLSRAAPIRKWIIETGPRGISSDLLQKFKNELRNRRITIDDILSFKNLPRILSDFQDAIILTKKGQRFIDLEVNALEDVSSKISDLEDARNELIMLSGVPAVYLGFGDVVELRDYLVNINVSFANDVFSIQESICASISELIDKIINVFYPVHDSITRYVVIHLTPPVLLMLQIFEATMGSISNVLTQTQAIPGIRLDPVTLLKQFVPYIDWDTLLEKGKELEVKLIGQELGSQSQ